MTRIPDDIRLTKDAALYVHVPFCVRKCGYCAFHSAAPSGGDIDAWLDGVTREALMIRGRFGSPLVKVRTAYIGGGTPTMLDECQWRALFDALFKCFDFSNCREFTVEANPGTVKEYHTRIWRGSRVTRVSLGVQSLDDGELRFLGRAHDAAQAVEAIRLLRRGFDVSADLIFGISDGREHQTLRSWRSSLRGLIDEGVKHISTYQLMIEQGTRFGDNPPDVPDGYPFYRYAQWYLPQKGFEQYEIASFAARGHECLHNLSYWDQSDVLALGPSAWGYLDGFRYKNAAPLAEYLEMLKDGLPVVWSETLSGDARGREAAVLALRTGRGIERAEFARRHGKALLDDVERELRDVPERCVSFGEARTALTPRGMRVGNAIWERIVGEAD